MADKTPIVSDGHTPQTLAAACLHPDTVEARAATLVDRALHEARSGWSLHDRLVIEVARLLRQVG